MRRRIMLFPIPELEFKFTTGSGSMSDFPERLTIFHKAAKLSLAVIPENEADNISIEFWGPDASLMPTEYKVDDLSNQVNKLNYLTNYPEYYVKGGSQSQLFLDWSLLESSINKAYFDASSEGNVFVYGLWIVPVYKGHALFGKRFQCEYHTFQKI